MYWVGAKEWGIACSGQLVEWLVGDLVEVDFLEHSAELPAGLADVLVTAYHPIAALPAVACFAVVVDQVVSVGAAAVFVAVVAGQVAAAKLVVLVPVVAILPLEDV